MKNKPLHEIVFMIVFVFLTGSVVTAMGYTFIVVIPGELLGFKPHYMEPWNYKLYGLGGVIYLAHVIKTEIDSH